MRLRLVPQETSFDFFRFRKITMGFSIVAMIVSVLLWIFVGLNFGIDFRGGTTIRTEATQEIDVGAYRDAVNALDVGEATIIEVFDPNFRADQNVSLIRIQAQDGEEAVTADVITRAETALQGVDPSLTFTSVESVGPKVSGELIQAALLAIAAAMAAILFYIWLRFEWQFSVGAVAALFHDVILTIGVFSILQIRFDLSTIAAILTIVGYSINDTIVVFDRIRENFRKLRRVEPVEVLNISVTETLARTLVTSLTTLLVVTALALFGGEMIFGFAVSLIVGVTVGTYSSIYVASVTALVMGVTKDDLMIPVKEGAEQDELAP